MTISAAGGLVWRDSPHRPDQLEVVLVHRPLRDDWSLPKGKLERGEHPLVAAVREVAEETGVRAVPRLSLPPTRYRVDGLPKVVDYWAMSAAVVADLLPNSEVDRVAWLPPAEAAAQASYRHDAELIRQWAATPPVTAVLLVVRHAEAGERYGSPAADQLRPLSSRGIAGAEALSRLLGLFAPGRLVSASPLRCRQSLAPMAAACDLPVEVDPVFDETTGDPDVAADRLRDLAETGVTAVVCSQGAVVPPVLARITGQPDGWATAKGDGWLVPFTGARPLAVTPLQTGRVRQ